MNAYICVTRKYFILIFIIVYKIWKYHEVEDK